MAETCRRFSTYIINSHIPMHLLVLFSYVDLICGTIRVFGRPSVNSWNVSGYPVSRLRYEIGTFRIQVRIDTLWTGIFGGHRTVHKYRPV